jgi:hypothetical protein
MRPTSGEQRSRLLGNQQKRTRGLGSEEEAYAKRARHTHTHSADRYTITYGTDQYLSVQMRSIPTHEANPILLWATKQTERERERERERGRERGRERER